MACVHFDFTLQLVSTLAWFVALGILPDSTTTLTSSFSNLVGKEHGLVSTQQQEDFPVVATKLPEQFQLLIKMSEGCFQLRFCAYDFSSWDFFPCLFFFLAAC